MSKRNSFCNIYCAKYATDLRLKQQNRVVGLFIEYTRFFRGKRSFCGFRTDDSVASTENLLFVSNQAPGSVLDEAIFRKGLDRH